MSPNALIHASSPYLRQHAHNPVDWHPWGEEAFALARRADKPVLLSIGYSTCHWCHVMERESFDDPEVAEVLNRVFVAIKVDREERPDLDAIYMRAAQSLNGGGGWPLNVLLTPDRQPFFAATYLPRHSRFGRMGIIELACRVEQLWQCDRDRILDSARSLTAALRHNAGRGESCAGPANAALADRAFDELADAFDRRHGGFGGAPKFPCPHQLLFLFRHGQLRDRPQATEMALETLRAMQAGGIHDHLGGGFHRYSTDEAWLLPHFEKMLYDQAMLLMAYAEGWQICGEASLADTARGIFTFLMRELRDAGGGFHAALDADSDGVEGKFYLWQADEIRGLLGERAEAFIAAYRVRDDGNVRDAMGELPQGANVLHHGARDDVAGLADERGILLAARNARTRPFRDEKVLADWNGLAVAALAKAGRILGDPAMLRAAADTADFILEQMQNEHGLLHCWHEDRPSIPAHLDDYAAVVWGLIELYETDFDPRWLDEALRLNADMLRLFAGDGGALYMAQDRDDLIMRPMPAFDGALPSGNAMAMHDLLRLSRLTGDAGLAARAEAIAAHLAGLAAQAPSGLAHLLSAVLLAESPAREIVLAGEPEALRPMLDVIRGSFRPNTVVLVQRPGLERLAPFTAGMKPLDGKPAAYVCENYQCRQPITDVKTLAKVLNNL